MTTRLLLASLALALAAAPARADTLVTSAASFLAGVTNATETTLFGLPYYSTATAVTLADGNTLTTGGDEVGASGTGYAPFTNGYAGDLLITNGTSETITFGRPLTAFGLYVSPDVGLALPGFLSNAVFTITLSNGQTTQVGGAFSAGDTQFLGFYGDGDISFLTIAVSGTNAFGGAIPDYAFGDIFSVPEPASLAVLTLGLLALGAARRRRA